MDNEEEQMSNNGKDWDDQQEKWLNKEEKQQPYHKVNIIEAETKETQSPKKYEENITIPTSLELLEILEEKTITTLLEIQEKIKQQKETNEYD